MALYLSDGIQPTAFLLQNRKRLLSWEEELGLLPLLPNSEVEKAVPSNEYLDIERGQEKSLYKTRHRG